MPPRLPSELHPPYSLLGACNPLPLVKVPACSHSVLPGHSSSLIADQPVGFDETLRGARNRMAALLASGMAEGADFAVAIENGLLQGRDGTTETWLDIGVVVLRNMQKRTEAVGSSCGVTFPTAAVGEWIEGGEEGTVGAVLAAERGCDPHDPHAHLTGQVFTRKTLLEQAVRVAAASLQYSSVPPADG